MRVTKVLLQLLGLHRDMAVSGIALPTVDGDAGRPRLDVRVRLRSRRRARCGRCAAVSPLFARGGGERSWRHIDIDIDVGFATSELVCRAPRVSGHLHGPTVAELPFARHDSAFTRAFGDLVVYEAIASSNQRVADRYEISWRAVNNACVRLATEPLGRIDLLDGLVAISIDEVK